MMTIDSPPPQSARRPRAVHSSLEAGVVPDSDAIRFVVDESCLGLVLTACTAHGVIAVLLGDDRVALQRDLQRRFPDAVLLAGDDAVRAVGTQVVRAIDAPGGGLDVPLDLRGTDFQRTVWLALREIPSGSRATYTEIANRIGMPRAARAVAQACAANPVAVVIPCHRVVRGDGTLSGYRWGVHRKRALLDREAGSETSRRQPRTESP